MDTFISWWLRNMVLWKSNWDTPQEESIPIQEEHSPTSEPLPAWELSSWYWSNLRAPGEMPRQMREPVSFVVGFSPPD